MQSTPSTATGSTLAHLTAADLAASSELQAFERLQAAGWPSGVVVVGSR